MRSHPLASLISSDDDEFPLVTHLPLHVQHVPDRPGNGEASGTGLALCGHCARANPHTRISAYPHIRILQLRPQALVNFLGPQAYLSPSVHPDVARVPSWNCVAVHCRVEERVVPHAEDKDALLKCMIDQHEPAYAAQRSAAQWRGLDEAGTAKMLQAIVAFEWQVLDWQCTWKLNQHRPESHAALYARYRRVNADEQALAQWMEDLGLVPEKEI